MVLIELGNNRFRLEMNREELDQFVRMLGTAAGLAVQQDETPLAHSLIHFVAEMGLEPL